MADPAEQRLAALRKRWEEDRSSAAFVPLAEEYRRLGRLSEAIAVLEQGMKAAPNYLSARIALGRCRLDLGDAAGACTILEQVVHQDPTQLVASKLLVEAYLRSRRPEQARERLNLYAVLNDRDPELDELRRRVQAGIRERDESSAASLSSPVASAPPVAPVVEVAPPAAPPVATAAPAAPVAALPLPPPVAATARPTGDIFQLPAVSPPAPDITRMAAPPPAVPVPRGTVFGGLGNPADRRRYVEALLRGGVFGQAAAPAEDAGAVPEVIEAAEFSWASVAVEPLLEASAP